MFLHQSKLNCPHLSFSLCLWFQLTGMRPGPSWSSQRCRVLQESSAGILSFAHFSALSDSNRSFAAGIMFFISSKSFLSRCLYRQIMNIRSHLSFSLCLLQRSLFCSLWPSTRGWRSTSWGNVLVTGVSHGPTFWAGLLCSWPSLQVSTCGCVLIWCPACLVDLMEHVCFVFAGIFYMCAYRMHECRRVAGSR